MNLFKILILLLASLSVFANDSCTYTEFEKNEIYAHYEYLKEKHPYDNTALKWLYAYSFHDEFSLKIQKILKINTYLSNGVSYALFKYYLLKEKIPAREDHEKLWELFIYVNKVIFKKNINIDFKLYEKLIDELCINISYV